MYIYVYKYYIYICLDIYIYFIDISTWNPQNMPGSPNNFTDGVVVYMDGSPRAAGFSHSAAGAFIILRPAMMDLRLISL